jgi:hypothetical protein
MPTRAAENDEGAGMSKGKKIALIAALVVVVPVAGYFLFSFASGMQKKFNDAQAKDDDPGVLGGQVGHIGELYNVLDATDPDKMGRNVSDGPGRGMAGKARKARSVAVNAGGADAGMEMDPASAIESLPATPAVWTLDVNAAKIPDGRVAGSVAGSNFVASSTFLLTGSATPVLAFRQGGFFSSDRELLVFIRLKPGEKLEGKTMSISKDQAAEVPQIMMRWKTSPPNPKVPMQQKPFPSGYAMKLEFGKMTADGLPGKIYVALPDREQSAIGGTFLATIRVVNTAQGKQVPPGGTVMMDEE